MKKVFLVIALIMISFLIAKNQSRRDTKTITINGHKFTVEIADTDEKRTKGLSNRDKLGESKGMLFVFPDSNYYRFWMKDMKFPLDFIWIDKDIVVDLNQNVSQPKSSDDKLVSFTAGKPFDKVLEVNAGTVKSLNIVIGNTID